tara:strand:- start:282 stop:1076 length:795 start_codon:yes stop_codon:yes gene_type:complete
MKRTIFVLMVFLFATVIVPSVNSSVPLQITELNKMISESSENWTTNASSVYVVDHFSNFDAINDNADGVHPNRNGDVKMAAAWTNSLLSLNLNLTENYSIMPLGDSITHLNYRYDLWLNLNDMGLIFDFVGNENHLPWAEESKDFNFDSDHEGHSGWRSDQIAYNIESWVKLNTPDIVLFHIGTNDIAQGFSPAHVTENIEKTIKILQLYNPEIIILVAQIIPYDFETNVNNNDFKFEGLEITFLFVALLIIEEVIRKNYFKNN